MLIYLCDWKIVDFSKIYERLFTVSVLVLLLESLIQFIIYPLHDPILLKAYYVIMKDIVSHLFRHVLDSPGDQEAFDPRAERYHKEQEEC